MIIDASVAAKWFLPREAYEEECLLLRKEYEDGKVEIRAPVLIAYEVLSAIKKRTDIPVKTAARLSEKAGRYLLGFSVTPYPSHLSRVVQNARSLGISVYDSSYATLSIDMQEPFISADRVLLARLGKIKPAPAFIGDYSHRK